MKYPTVLTLALITAVSLAAGPLRAGDWPQWRGPNFDGSADEKNLLVGYQLSSGAVVVAPVSRPLLEALRGSWQVLEVLPGTEGQHECRQVELRKPVSYAILG